MATKTLEAREKVHLYRKTALEELELMHAAIEAGDYRAAKRHKKAANAAIDKVVAARKTV